MMDRQRWTDGQMDAFKDEWMDRQTWYLTFLCTCDIKYSFRMPNMLLY